MSRRHLYISIAVAVIVVIFATVIFTRNSTAPDAEGSTTANSAAEQINLPAGPATEPAETTTAQ